MTTHTHIGEILGFEQVNIVTQFSGIRLLFVIHVEVHAHTDSVRGTAS